LSKEILFEISINIRNKITIKGKHVLEKRNILKGNYNIYCSKRRLGIIHLSSATRVAANKDYTKNVINTWVLIQTPYH
jgi:hypothetical protein